jgi:hypothetical protein
VLVASNVEKGSGHTALAPNVNFFAYSKLNVKIAGATALVFEPYTRIF